MGLDILKLELAELAVIDIDFDLSLTGFCGGEIDVVLQGRRRSRRRSHPCRAGQPAHAAGRHLDARRAPRSAAAMAAIPRSCGGRRRWRPIDAAFLDPPYNVKINGHANAKGRHREFAMASGEMSEAAFRTFLPRALARAPRSRATVRCISSAWTGATCDDVAAVGTTSTASCSTSASGTSATPAWARSIAQA